MATYGKDILEKLGYMSIFGRDISKEGEDAFIKDKNTTAIKLSLLNEKELEEITSIYINYPPLLLRKKSMLYPEGRTSYRFKRALRKKVTILDK